MPLKSCAAQGVRYQELDAEAGAGERAPALELQKALGGPPSRSGGGGDGGERATPGAAAAAPSSKVAACLRAD